MKPELVVVTGPTASGKTGLAIKLAKQFNGEVISADSRAIFKGIDIASAKPDLIERDGVVHWGFDLVEPNQRFTAADFKDYAYKKIDDIIVRGKVPFLVGGTGLYVDAVLRNYNFGGDVDFTLREELVKKTTEELIEYCKNNNIELPENHKNKRYLIRAIEKSLSGEKHNGSPKYRSVAVGIQTDREVLRERIWRRNRNFMKTGIIEEAINLADKYGWRSEAMTANAYPLIEQFLKGDLSEELLIEKMSVRDWRLAKRQIAFMKRNKEIKWLTLERAEQYISSKLKN